ncbi:hypothetical protein H0H93_000267, partial [Arthromyces matolae]
KRTSKRSPSVVLQPSKFPDEEDTARAIPFTESSALSSPLNMAEKGIGFPSFTQEHWSGNDSNNPGSVTGSTVDTSLSMAEYPSPITPTASPSPQGIKPLPPTRGPLTTTNPSDGTQNTQNLKDLVSEFNNAVLAHGEANARVTELQNRINSELAGRGVTTGELVPPVRRDTVFSSGPPPYEPRRD